VLRYTYTDWGRIGYVKVIPNGSTSISFLQFSYNKYGQVKRISNYDHDTAPKVNFYYSPNYYETTDISCDYKGYLKKIEFINENQVVATTSYEYDSNGRLIAAHDDASGYSVRYTYSGNRVVSITEYAGADDTQGQTGLVWN
jgi:YD repeat-containing protein